jgi:hypothetical protein
VGEVLVVAAKYGKDAADHLAAGHDRDAFEVVSLAELDTLCSDDDAAPEPPLVVVRRAKSGATFVLDDPADLDPIWGEGDDVLWASGEPLLVVGPTGVGKTTVILQVVAGLLGIATGVLGHPVAASERPVLYLAMDRPRQIRRAMRRIFGEQHRGVLEEKLIVWEGPLDLDLGRCPEHLLEVAQRYDAGTIIADSLKDAVIKLTDDEYASNLNRAFQLCMADDRNVAASHHQRKGQGGGRPNGLEDVYGSTWITAGVGSVVLLWGAAGDPIVELVHLTQPAGEVGPFKIVHDHDLGTSSVFRQVDPLEFVQGAPRGVTAESLAVAMFETDKPTHSQREKARRKLDRLARDGFAHKRDGGKGDDGKQTPALYFPTTWRREMGL